MIYFRRDITYIIAGASSDIGRELIKYIAENENGAVIYAHYNNGIDKLKELAKVGKIKVMLEDVESRAVLEAAGGLSGAEVAEGLSNWDAEKGSSGENAVVIPVKADLSEESGVEDLLNAINEKSVTLGLSGIDNINHFVFLPARKFDYMRIKDLDMDKIRKEMEISAYSFLRISKELIPGMKKMENSSITAMLTKYVTDELPPKFMTDYIVSKYALMGAVKSLQAEIGNKINVNYLAPDMIETAFLDNIDPRIIEMNKEASGGLLQPKEVAITIYDKIK